MYIKKLILSDFRCFEQTEIAFQTPTRSRKGKQQNVTVLRGTNGAGKTTLLQGLALGLLNEALRDTGLLFRNSVRRQSGDVEATLHASCLFNGALDGGIDGSGQVYALVQRVLSGDAPQLGSVKLPRKSAVESKRIWLEASRSPDASSFFLVGYGAQRRPSQAALFDLSQQDRRYHARAQRVASLFVDDLALVPLAAWWSKSKAREEVQALLDKVLPEELRLTTRQDDAGELLVKFRGVELPETALSDGYRAFLGWFGDLLYRLIQVKKSNRKLKNISGVVLVDEIDLHLHPSWQQSVIDRVSEALPALQFIVTTHSPLIVGGVRRAGLRILRVDAQGAVTVHEPEEETYGRTPDQILLSDSFGLKEVRPATFVEDLKKARQKVASGGVAEAVRYTRMLALGEAGKESP